MLLSKIKSILSPSRDVKRGDSSISDAGHLHLVYADDPAACAGVVKFRLSVMDSAQSGSLLRVSTDRGPDELAIPDLSPGQMVEIGMHFVMLDHGQHTIRFELTEPDGTRSLLATPIGVDHAPGLAEQTARYLRASGTPLFFKGACDSSMYPYGETTAAWFDRPDADEHITGLLQRGEINTVEAEQLRSFVRDGFLVLPDLIDEKLIADVNAEIDDAIERGYQGYKFGTSQRIEHLHAHYPKVRALWLDARHRRYANLIFGATARPCQTLTYVFGSQQDAHQDTIHLTPFPAGFMCGTWIALQDVVPDSGELVVYPGSHRERRIYLAETGCEKVDGDWTAFGQSVGGIWAGMAKRYEPFVYRPKKGTVLIWHENLLHAGSSRIDQTLQRRSIVIHCFADGVVAYYDSTGLAGSAVSRAEIA